METTNEKKPESTVQYSMGDYAWMGPQQDLAQWLVDRAPPMFAAPILKLVCELPNGDVLVPAGLFIRVNREGETISIAQELLRKGGKVVAAPHELFGCRCHA